MNVLDEKRKGQDQGWLASTQGPRQPDGTWASLHSVQHFQVLSCPPFSGSLRKNFMCYKIIPWEKARGHGW